jgi:hypothetical protein
MKTAVKISVPLALFAAALGWGVAFPAMLQSQEYHRFADTRALFAIVNAGDTLSNLAFLLVGALSCGTACR